MKLAIFDFDGTLFPRDTLPFLLTQWKKLKYPRVKYYKIYLSLIALYIQYKLGIETNMTKEQMKLRAVQKFNHLFYGMTEKDLASYFTSCSQAIKGLLNQSVVDEVKQSRKEGYHTVLLSGAYQELLERIGQELQFDTVIGTEMHFKDGLFDDEKEVETITGKLKIQKIYEIFDNREVDWKASLAYADSYSDIDILQAVGQPVAVNPENKLKAIAVDSNWRIMTTDRQSIL